MAGGAGRKGRGAGGPRVYLVIGGGPRSHHIVIGGLVVIVERLRGLGAGRGTDGTGIGKLKAGDSGDGVGLEGDS